MSPNYAGDAADTIFVSLVAGGAAGLATDIVLFPMDTLKTRLQTSQGFLKSGGFRGVYKGLGSIMLGSVPTCASFFCAYELSKFSLSKRIENETVVHSFGSSIAGIVSLLVNVPFEVVKQRAQAVKKFNSWRAFKYTVRSEGFLGLYRGFSSNTIRDIPYIVLEMTMWEFFKKTLHRYRFSGSEHYHVEGLSSLTSENELSAFESGCCGGLAAGISGFITTPLDVAKTRIMVAKQHSVVATMNPFSVVYKIGSKEGLAGLFSGAMPSVVMCSIFLGAYDKAKAIMKTWIIEGNTGEL